MDGEVAWWLGLALACIASVAMFLFGRRIDASPGRRRLLFAVAALLAFASAWPVALTGLFYLIFGATGYCDDPGGGCVSRWWVPIAVFVLLVAFGLAYLTVESVKAYRRIEP
jgi:hypothetical protein